MLSQDAFIHKAGIPHDLFAETVQTTDAINRGIAKERHLSILSV